jgi:hypothetical protein
LLLAWSKPPLLPSSFLLPPLIGFDFGLRHILQANPLPLLTVVQEVQLQDGGSINIKPSDDGARLSRPLVLVVLLLLLLLLSRW